MNLSFERKPPPEPAPRPGCQNRPWRNAPTHGPAQDMLEVSLGRACACNWYAATRTIAATITRGLLAVGDTGSALPENEPERERQPATLDIEFWRGLIDHGSNGSGRDGSTLPPCRPCISICVPPIWCFRKRASTRCASRAAERKHRPAPAST
jgi:hypothetical protein